MNLVPMTKQEKNSIANKVVYTPVLLGVITFLLFFDFNNYFGMSLRFNLLITSVLCILVNNILLLNIIQFIINKYEDTEKLTK